MFAQPDEYIILVFSLIAIVFWYRLRTRVEMSQEIGTESKLRSTSFLVPFLRRKARSQLFQLITKSGLLVHLYLNAARDINHIKVQGQFSSEFQVREIN